MEQDCPCMAACKQLVLKLLFRRKIGLIKMESHILKGFACLHQDAMVMYLQRTMGLNVLVDGI